MFYIILILAQNRQITLPQYIIIRIIPVGPLLQMSHDILQIVHTQTIRFDHVIPAILRLHPRIAVSGLLDIKQLRVLPSFIHPCPQLLIIPLQITCLREITVSPLYRKLVVHADTRQQIPRFQPVARLSHVIKPLIIHDRGTQPVFADKGFTSQTIHRVSRTSHEMMTQSQSMPHLVSQHGCRQFTHHLLTQRVLSCPGIYRPAHHEIPTLYQFQHGMENGDMRRDNLSRSRIEHHRPVSIRDR